MSDDLMVSGAVIAKCCSITRRQHSNLVRDRLMPKPVKRKYDLVASMSAFLVYRVAEGPASAASERLRLMAARREKIEIENARERGELIPAKTFDDALLESIHCFISALKPMPARVSAIGAHKEQWQLREIIEEETRHVRDAVHDSFGALAENINNGQTRQRQQRRLTRAKANDRR